MSIRLKNKEELRSQIFTMEQLQNQKFSVEEYFDNQNPVILDAGCGKGEFLLDLAKLNPQLNYVGVDYSWKKCLFSQKKMHLHEIKNVMIIRAAFEEVFPAFFNDDTFITVHMNFPDPWPKKKHHKRRSLQQKLVAEFVRLLKPNGNFYFVTDSLEYAQYAFPVIENNVMLQNQFPQINISNSLDGYFRTLFCSKAEDRGEKINYIWFQKK